MKTFASTGRFRRSRLFAVGVLCASLVAPALASRPPNILDDNRDDTALSLLESGLFTTAIGVLGFSVNPLIGTYLPVDITGRVLAHP